MEEKRVTCSQIAGTRFPSFSHGAHGRLRSMIVANLGHFAVNSSVEKLSPVTFEPLCFIANLYVLRQMQSFVRCSKQIA